MTKEETVKILAILGAFYGGGKTDPQAQASAWHAILQKYPYEIAEKAVFNFAENDVRDYATFPAVGKIVQAMREEANKRGQEIAEVIKAISYGRPYESLSDDGKKSISESTYNGWLSMDPEEFAYKTGVLAEYMRRQQKRIEG